MRFFLVILLCACANSARAQQLQSTRPVSHRARRFSAKLRRVPRSRRKRRPDDDWLREAIHVPRLPTVNSTPERDIDWKATIAQGGHGRGFSRIMPSFAEALTSSRLTPSLRFSAVSARTRLGTRRTELPRPLRTEKAYPESETVLTVGATTDRARLRELAREAVVGARSLRLRFRSAAFRSQMLSAPAGSVMWPSA